ncbi:YigZ family protein [Spiroplasma endosymbiont of Panorpa germanica]|uniref:IMPACT family protein n=1 Tax=Spiroplasma endosymbiont of Panorpa germanica TaxID=3066314 RepID=UPI0030CE16B5
MRTVKNEVFKGDYEVKKSKFKVIITQVNSKAEVDGFLSKYSDPKASHNCYAFVIDDNPRSESFHNDGEPSGTAGEPLLNLIKKLDLSNTIILVTRYFGGIKLGAGPLMRAYNSSANNLLKNCIIEELQPGYEISITFSLSNLRLVDSVLLKYQIVAQKKFDERANYAFITTKKEITEELNPFVEINYIINKFVSQV